MGLPRAVALVALLMPAAVLAQPTAKEKKKASELVKQAIAKSQAGDHESAVTLYDDAYKIIPQPLLLSNIGSEYQALNKPVEALKFFCKYLDADPNGNNATFVIAQAKTLYIDLGGVDTVEDADVCKPIVKPQATPTPPPPTDHPPKDTPQPPPKDKKPSAHESSGSKASPLRWVGAGVAVAGAASFTVGVLYGMKARDISDQISNHDPTMPWPTNIHSLESTGQSDEKKQIIFMAAGGIAIAGGVALFFLAPRKAKDNEDPYVTFAPLATPESVGMVAAGRF